MLAAMESAALANCLPIDEFRTCYHDSGDGCDCRKPLPGALLAAARQHGMVQNVRHFAGLGEEEAWRLCWSACMTQACEKTARMQISRRLKAQACRFRRNNGKTGLGCCMNLAASGELQLGFFAVGYMVPCVCVLGGVPKSTSRNTSQIRK